MATTMPILQLIAYVMLMLASVTVAAVSTFLAYRNNFGSLSRLSFDTAQKGWEVATLGMPCWHLKFGTGESIHLCARHKSPS